MSPSVHRLFLAGALLVVAQLVSESHGSLFPESFEGLNGNDLCQFNEARISRVSTIKKLIEAFETSGADAACRADWIEPLNHLQIVLDASAQDACSMDTIQELEKYHWYYVVGSLSKSWKKASEASLPEPLRLFFIHFARELLEQCKSNVGSRLREAISSSQAQTMSLSGASMGATLKTLSVAMVPAPKIKNYDDFFFMYQAIINSEKKKGNLVEETIPNPVTGEIRYFSVKVHDASKTNELQEKCKQELHPVYSSTVLPIMKLIDLGFGISGQHMKKDEQLLAQWYEIAQFCEFLLPIKFYSSQELRKDQAALVKDDDEIKLLEQNEPVVSHDMAKHFADFSPVKLGDIIPEAENDRIAKEVKTSFKSRIRVYRKTLRNSLATAKYELTSRFKKFFVSKKSNNQFITEDQSDEMLKLMVEAEKEVVRDELEEKAKDVTETHENGLVRHKRQTTKSSIPQKSYWSTVSLKTKTRLVGLFIWVVIVIFLVLLWTGTIHIG